jgi:tetratricopeptide (TPR) repeat protein
VGYEHDRAASDPSPEATALIDTARVTADEDVLGAAAVLGPAFPADLFAEVTGLDRETALDALAATAGPDLVAVDTGGARFVDHDALRRLRDGLPPSRRARVHARAADALLRWRSGGRAIAPERVAVHLLGAGDTRRGAELLLEAGAEAMRAGRYEAAVGHHSDAQEALDGTDAADDLAATAAIGLGHGRLALGDVHAAREAFVAAVGPARRARRADLLAGAALGLGSGPTGFEVPLVDREQLDLLQESLDDLGDDSPALRARVLARLSVAATVVEDEARRRRWAEEAVDLARATGDRQALATALAAQCDVLAGPEYTATRGRLAEQIVSVAREAGDRETELLGRRYLLVALAEVGNLDGVDAQIRDFGALSDLVGQPMYAWYVPLWRAMRALMVGRSDECRRQLDDVRRIGARAGSANAHLLAATLTWCLLSELGESGELRELAEQLAIDDIHELWAEVASALMAAETGRLDEARTRLDAAAPHLADAPRYSEWVPMLSQVAELVGQIGGHPVASWTYEALRPFAEQLVVEGIGAAVRGSVHRHLGLLAATLGRTREADEHFSAALERHRALGAPLLVARTLHDRGRALDDAEALAQALTAYERLGIDPRVASVREELGRRVAGTGARRDGPADPGPGEQGRFARDGDLWCLTFAGATVRVSDAKGLHDLATLLAAPGRPVPAVELVVDPTGRSGAGAPGREDRETLHQAGDLGDVVDATARAAYRRRLRELDEAVEEARDRGDDDGVEAAETERDRLVQHLTAAYGLAGRPRRAGDPAERARSTVTARIRDSIRRVEAVHPDLGRHLRLSVRTGTLCVYEPERTVHWSLH